MKLTEAKLKKMIAEQAVISLMEKDELIDAIIVYANNKDLLDEGLLDRLIPAKFTSAGINRLLKKIEQEEPEKKRDLGAALQALVVTQNANVNKNQQQYAQDVAAKAPNVEPENRRTIAQLLDFLDNNDADLAKAKAAAAAETGDKPEAAETGAAAPETAKPAPVAKTVKDVRDLIVDPTQRRFLLRGLLTLLTNDSVERAISIIKPEQAKTAVLNFLKQITDMEPKAYKKFKAGMQGKLYKDLLASDKAFAPGPRAKKMRKQAAGAEASKAASAELGKLGLSEGVDQEITEVIAILEALDVIYEKTNIRENLHDFILVEKINSTLNKTLRGQKQMKITKEQLKQIIREELSEQSFMDRLKGFFGGKKEEPAASKEASKEPEQSKEEKAAAVAREEMDKISKSLDSAQQFMSDTKLYKLADAYQRANSSRYEKTKGANSVKFYAEAFGIPEDQRFRTNFAARRAIAKYIMQVMSPGGAVYDAKDPAEKLKTFYDSIGNALKTTDAFYGRTFDKDTQDELEQRKRELDARFAVDDSADEFLRRHESKNKTGSKLTKEAIKQIIREEIKNVKGNK